jgi:hypothetical protein
MLQTKSVILLRNGERADNMRAWKYKSCLRCGGDVYIGKDEYDLDEKCLQCSFERELKVLKEFKQQRETKKLVVNGKQEK